MNLDRNMRNRQYKSQIKNCKKLVLKNIELKASKDVIIESFKCFEKRVQKCTTKGILCKKKSQRILQRTYQLIKTSIEGGMK